MSVTENTGCFSRTVHFCIKRGVFFTRMSVGELIEELRRRAGYSKDGKMGEECIVPKTLLADAADKLEKLSNNEAACYYEPSYPFFKD